jgi:hypothetical protein
MSMENQGGMISTEETDSSTIALWQSYQQSSSCKAGGSGEVNDEFRLMKYLLHTSKGSSTCRKILRHGADGVTSPLNMEVLRIFIALVRV